MDRPYDVMGRGLGCCDVGIEAMLDLDKVRREVNYNFEKYVTSLMDDR